MNTVTSSWICETVRELLPAYALGALDEHEEHFVETHLSDCGDLTEELAGYARAAEAVQALASPVIPPPALKARLMAEANQLLVEKPTPSPVISMPKWIAFSMAAAAAILIGGIAVLGIMLSRAQDDLDAAEVGQRHLAYYLAAGGVVTQLSAQVTDPEYPSAAKGVVVTAPGMPAMIIVTGCLPTKDDRIYRVWYAKGDDRTGMGELVVDENGDGWMELGSADLLENVTAVGVTMVSGNNRSDWLTGPMPDTQTNGQTTAGTVAPAITSVLYAT